MVYDQEENNDEKKMCRCVDRKQEQEDAREGINLF